MSLSLMARRDFLKLTLMGGVAAGAQPAAAHAAAAPGPVELRMWNNHPEWKNALLANLAVFEKSSGIKIQLEPKPGPEYVQLLSAAVQAGEAPDVPGIPPGPLLDQFLDNGYVLDLTGKVHVDRLTPLCQERVTRKGKIVGIPFGAYTIGMYYQKEIFTKNGIQEPKTWDELKAACEKLKKAGITPLMMPAKDGVIPSWYYMLAAASVLGRAGFKDLLAGKRKLSDPDLAAVPQLLVALAAYYPEGFASISYAEGKATFARGGTAMILGGTADYAGYVAVNKDAKLDFFPFPPPSASAGAPATLTGFELINAVSKNSKQVDAAVKLVDWFTTEESAKLFANSITLPSVKGVLPGNNPVWTKQSEIASKYDLPAWRELNPFAPVWNELTKNMQAVLLKQMPPDKLAQQVQSVFKVP